MTLLPLGMLVAYTGTILPDDGISGGSLSVITGVLLSVPVIGTHLVFWILGGAPPGHEIIGGDGAAPDWYRGFLDGPLRIMPAWDVPAAGHPLALGLLEPGLVVPGLFFTCLAAHPMADRQMAGGRAPRGLLPPVPADLANRTAAGVAGITFYGLLWAAAANDQIAYHLQVPLYTVTWIFRVLVLTGPALAFLLIQVICHALADQRRDEELHDRADRDEPARRLHRNPRASPPGGAA